MDMQNIGVNNRDDAFYRYKMPKMNTKIEGRGNGIKTNVVNMVEIAKALARPASYTTKYFGCELGAQSKFDEKTGISLVNGAHGTGILEGLLENFIRKYVQCYNCQNPETEILITKSQMIQLKCAACGFLSDVDMRDKLTSFILKNPPETKKGSKDKKAMRRAEKVRLKEGDAADEEQKKLKKESKKKTSSKEVTVKTGLSKKKANGSDEDRTPLPTPSPSPTVDEDEDSEDDVEWQTDTSLEAARLQIQEQLNSVTAEMVMLSTHDEDKKKKKTKAANGEKKNGSPKSSSLPAAEDNGKIENGGKRHEMLVQEAKAYLKKGVAADQFRPSSAHSSAASAQELMTALYEAILGDTEKGFAKEIAKKKKYLAAAVAQSEESQSLLLRGNEEFCKKQNPAAAAAVAVKEVALVLKALYDGDILEEEYIVQWYQQGLTGGNKDSPVWKNAKPFVDWLQSAESESDGE